MARLSDPESLVRKLTDLGDHIDEFYQTAELAKQIKDRLIQFHDTALRHEKRFETRTAEMENLKTGYEKNLLILQELISRSQEELGRILTDLGYEKNSVVQFIKKLSANSEALQNQYKEAENFLSSTIKETGIHMAWMSAEQSASLRENRYLILRDLDENRVNAKKESDSLLLFSEQMQEELSYLAEQTEQWRDNAENRLHKELNSFEYLKDLYKKAVQEIANTGRKYETERAGLVDAFRTEKQAVQAEVEKLICERRIFREDLLILEREKASILKEITAQSAWISEQSAAFLRDMQYRIAQHLDENRNLLFADRDTLALFAQETGEEILLHKAEQEFFEKQTKTRIAKRIREFDNIRSEYEKLFRNVQGLAVYCETELPRMLTDLGFEKQNLRKTAHQLAAEYQQALQRHQQMQQENEAALHSITGQISYAEQSVQENLAHIRVRAAQSVEEHRIHMQNAWEELSSFSNEIREEISHLQNDAEKFLNRKAFALSRMAHALKLQAEHFRKSGIEKIEAHLAFETSQLHQQSAQEFQNLHTALEQEKVRFEHLTDKRIEQGLSELSDIKKEISHQTQWFRQMWNQWESFCREADTWLSGLRNLMISSDRDFMEIRTDFAYEKMQISNQIRQLEQKHAQIRDQQNKSEHFLGEYLRKITERISYESSDLQKKFYENDCRIAEQMDEHRQRLEQEKAGFSLVLDQMQEENLYLADEMERFRNETLAHLNHRYRELARKQEKILQSVSEECRSMFSEQTRKLRSEIDAEKKEISLVLDREKAVLAQSLLALNSDKEQFYSYTARFKEICEKSDEVEEKSRNMILRLTEIGERAEAELQRIIMEFLGEQEHVHQALESIAREQSELRTQYQNFSQEAALTGRNMTEQLMVFRENSGILLQEIHSRFEQETDEYKISVRKEAETLNLSFSQAQEKIGHLKEELTDFQQKILSDTEQKISGLSALQDQLRKSIAEETNGNLNEKFAEFQHKILSDTDHKISNLSALQDQLRKSIAEEINGNLNEKLAGFQQKILADTDQKISDLSALQDQFRQRIAEETNGNLNEKFAGFQQKILADTDQKISSLSALQEHLRQSIAEESNRNLNEKIAEFQQRILADTEQKISNLSALQDQFRQSITEETNGNLNEKLAEFQQRILADTDHKISNLSALQDRLRKSIAEENNGNLNEKLAESQQRILADTEQKISNLSGLQDQLRKSIAEETNGNLNEKFAGFQQKILADTDHKISNLSALQDQFRQRIAKELEKRFLQIGKQESAGQEKERFEAALAPVKSEQSGIRQDQKSLSQKLDRMDTEMRQISLAIRQYAEKEMKRVSGEVDTAKKEIWDTKKHLGSFAEQIKERLRLDSEKQIVQQADFRKKIIAALIARLGEDLRKLQDQDEINLRECREEIRRSDKNLHENMENLEAGITENLDRIKAEQEKIVPFVRKNISSLAERQKNQGEILKELGERIKSIEDFLKSRTRKG